MCVDDVTVSWSVHALWWFESADERAEQRHRAHTDARVVAAGETALESGSSEDGGDDVSH